MLQLKEDSPLYGKKGTIVSNKILQNIPKKHHSLFEEAKESSITFKDNVKPSPWNIYEKMMNELRQARNNQDVEVNIPIPDIPENYFEDNEELENDELIHPF